MMNVSSDEVFMYFHGHGKRHVDLKAELCSSGSSRLPCTRPRWNNVWPKLLASKIWVLSHLSHRCMLHSHGSTMEPVWNLYGTSSTEIILRGFKSHTPNVQTISVSPYSVKVQNLTDCGHLLEGDVQHAGQNQEEIELYPVAPWMAQLLLAAPNYSWEYGTELYLRITYIHIIHIHIDTWGRGWMTKASGVGERRKGRDELRRDCHHRVAALFVPTRMQQWYMIYDI